MRSRSFPLLGLGIAAACLVSAPSTGNAAQAPEAESGVPELISADVTIERRIIGPNGEVVHELPPVSYRVDRAHAATRRRTTVSFGRSPAGRHRSARPDATSGLTVEFDEQAALARVYDPKGVLLTLPPLEQQGERDPSVAQGGAGARRTESGFIAARSKARERRQHLERDLGRSVGKVGGLDRFLATRDRVTHEVLVAPSTAVPIEANLSRDGRLESHLRFEYQRLADGSLFRIATHAESVIPGQPQHRLLTHTTLSNVETTESR